MIDALHRVLPTSASIVRELRELTADTVFKACKRQGVSVNIVRLGLDDWEIEASDLTDDERLAMLQMENAGHQGRLLMCTEACTRYNLPPFECHSSDLASFISIYDRECFFDGDVIFLCEESRTITVYHHAGVFAHVRCE